MIRLKTLKYEIKLNFSNLVNNFLFEFSVESQCAAVDRNKMDDMPLISCKSFVYKKCNELDVLDCE